jgi:hypothetical protein
MVQKLFRRNFPGISLWFLIAIAEEAFNRKTSLLTSKLNIELKNKLVRCCVWSIALYGSETWTQRKLKRKYFEVLKYDAGGEWRR